MSQDSMLIAYTLRLADNALILAQRMVELVAAEPELEEELANANFALDYIGQARMFYTHAGHLEGRGPLTRCSDAGLVEIAARAVKEVTYHRRHSAKWLIRLGDGTELSHDRAQASLDDVWRYTGEMFAADAIDMALQENYDGPDLAAIQTLWLQDVSETVAEATLKLPEDEWMASGGKQGKHSEHLGFLLAEMQYLQRSFPGATW